MKKLLIFVFALFSILTPLYSSAWQIWIAPCSSTYHVNETDSLVIGITGYGELKPENVKIVAHTIMEIELKNKSMKAGYDSLIFPFTENISDSIFISKSHLPIDNDAPNKNIFIESDIKPLLEKIYICPKSSGNYYVDFFVTYSSNGIDWETITKRYDFHVNSWYEDNEIFINIVILVVSLMTIFSIIWSSILTIKESRKKRNSSSKQQPSTQNKTKQTKNKH